MLITKRKPASVGEILVEELMHSPRERQRIERARPLIDADAVSYYINVWAFPRVFIPQNPPEALM